MALMKCPECDATVSEHASACASCGYPLAAAVMKVRVAVPAIPAEIYEGLRKASRSSGRILHWRVREGDWVTKGQVVAEYRVSGFPAQHASRGAIQTKATVEAPLTGRVSRIAEVEFTRWSWDALKPLSSGRWMWEGEASSYVHLQDASLLFAVDSLTDVPNLKAYAAYENIVDYGYLGRANARHAAEEASTGMALKALRWMVGAPAGPAHSMFTPDDFPPSALEGLANSPLKRIVLGEGSAE